MDRPSAWPTVHDQSDHHTRHPVPAFSAAWARDLPDAVGLRPGDHVLVAAWRGGIVARTAAAPSSLPFRDASFDVVLCHQGLQLCPDRGRVLSEMRRVLVPSGRVAVSVWGPIERSPAFAALAHTLERHAGVQVAAAVRWLFSLSEPGDLRAFLAGAGFDDIRVRTSRKTARLPSVGEFLRQVVSGSPLGSAATHLSEDQERRIVADLEAELAAWIDAEGLRITTYLNTGVARPLRFGAAWPHGPHAPAPEAVARNVS